MCLSIRYQLLLPLLTLFLGMVGMSTWTAVTAADRVRVQIETHLADIAGTVRTVTFPRNAQTLGLMKGLSAAEFLLCDGHGRPLRDDQGQPLTTLAALPQQLPAPSEQAAKLEQRVAIAGGEFFCLGVALGGGGQPEWILYIFYPENLMQEAVWQAVWPALLLGGLGGLASLALTVAVTGRLTRRFWQIERRTRLVAGGDFSPMPLPGHHDELRDLGSSINDMAQRLARLQETVRQTERLRLLGQVGGGLAHQLRNGVTGARLAVQLHSRACPAQADGESLAVALRQLSLVEMYLKRFLNLGRAVVLRRQPCDLRRLLDDTLALLEPNCRHAHVELRGRAALAGQPVTVDGDAEQLGYLFVNVLGNAVEAAAEGGWVEVRLEYDASRAWIEVLDSGPGPPESIATRLFEPFVTGKPDGVGLGLALAKQLAEAHGGAIAWSRRDAATCFRIELPLEKE